MSNYISPFVNLEEQDYCTIKRVALEKGLGEKGFSAAVRLIIREWELHRGLIPQDHPAPETQDPWLKPSWASADPPPPEP